jgi:hypothetical protein
MQGKVLIALHILIHIKHKFVNKGYYYLHFAYQKRETQNFLDNKSEKPELNPDRLTTGTAFLFMITIFIRIQ